MYHSIDEAINAYREILFDLGKCYRRILDEQSFALEKLKKDRGITGTIVENPALWNSKERYEFVIRDEHLRGAERVLGLSENECEEGRRSVGLPENVQNHLKREEKKVVAV